MDRKVTRKKLIILILILLLLLAIILIVFILHNDKSREWIRNSSIGGSIGRVFNGDDITHTHTWGNWVVIVPPTCIKEGEETRTCMQGGCNETETRFAAINPNAHNWIYSPLAVVPTCTTTGSGRRECRDCHTVEDISVIPMLPHTFVNWIQTIAPTCRENGIETGVCFVCNTTGTRPGAPASPIFHTFVNWIQTTAPTCSAEGLETGRCSHIACDATGTRPGAPIEPDAHYWGYWIQTTAPTCRARGLDTRTCYYDITHTESRIGAPVDSNAHTWNTWVAIIPQTPCIQRAVCGGCNEVSDMTRHNIPCTGTIVGPQGLTLNGTILVGTGVPLSLVCIPANVTSIHNEAFSDCNVLTMVTFSPGSRLETIGNGAFERSAGLTSITIPSSVRSIGNWAFDGCASLNTIIFAQDSILETIGFYAYRGTGITSITIPPNVTSIGIQAFAFTRLTSITIPLTVTAIQTRAFEGWNSSQIINIPFTTLSEADTAWGVSWRVLSNAVIRNNAGQQVFP
jgi:hypothetical protein